jgi:hypothetical protein
MLRHYIFLKYRAGTSDAHVTAFCERMLALRGVIGEIVQLEIGRDELHDVRSWDVVLIMEFASVAALRVYQRHPQHLAVMAFNEPFVANVASVDFTRPYEGSDLCES